MKTTITFLFALLSLFSNAQTEKRVVVDANAVQRNVADFNAIDVSGSIDIYISQGKENAVAVSAANNEFLERIKTEVKNGVLKIYFDGKGWSWKSWGNHKMKAYVTVKELLKISSSGACNVRVLDELKSDDLKIDFSGASDFRGKLNVTNLKIDLSGACYAEPTGYAENLNVDISGASNLKAFELKADNCKAEASGASNARLLVAKELKAFASGGSNIYYKGDADIKTAQSSGGATIKKRNN